MYAIIYAECPDLSLNVRAYERYLRTHFEGPIPQAKRPLSLRALKNFVERTRPNLFCVYIASNNSQLYPAFRINTLHDESRILMFYITHRSPRQSPLRLEMHVGLIVNLNALRLHIRPAGARCRRSNICRSCLEDFRTVHAWCEHEYDCFTARAHTRDIDLKKVILPKRDATYAFSRYDARVRLHWSCFYDFETSQHPTTNEHILCAYR